MGYSSWGSHHRDRNELVMENLRMLIFYFQWDLWIGVKYGGFNT